MKKENSLHDFYEVIDSNFEEYEKSGLDKDKYIDLKNNIAKSMLETFKSRYREESDIYMHCSMVFMKTINDCVNSYIKISPQDRTGKFHSYFFKIFKKNINESIRLEQEESALGITFGEETEKACSARQKLRRIKKDYEDLCNYEDNLSEEQIIEEIAIIERTTADDIKKFIPFINTRTIDAIQQNPEGEKFSPIDSEQKDGRKTKRSLEVPEELVISRDNMRSILDKIDEIFQNQDDSKFLSTVITFKILSCFEPNKSSKTANSSTSANVISYLPDSYRLDELLIDYAFIDHNLLKAFFEKGELPQQKDIERSQGSVNNKWKQFNKKLLDKYRPELKDIEYD